MALRVLLYSHREGEQKTSWEMTDLQFRKNGEAMPLYYSEAQSLACISRMNER